MCHRAYTEEGARVMIEIYDDRVSIVSPGSVPKGITKENFGKRSIARNPIIADLLRRSHYIEKIGTGIRRMQELMENAGLKGPEFRYDEFFEVTFFRPSYYDKDYGTYDLSKNKVYKKQERLSKLQNKMLKLIIANSNITQTEMAKELNVSRQSIATNMGKMKKNNIIERVGSNKQGYWKIIE